MRLSPNISAGSGALLLMVVLAMPLTGRAQLDSLWQQFYGGPNYDAI